MNMLNILKSFFFKLCQKLFLIRIGLGFLQIFDFCKSMYSQFLCDFDLLLIISLKLQFDILNDWKRVNINQLVPTMQILEHMPLEKRHYSHISIYKNTQLATQTFIAKTRFS